jgi:hypothetical protein
MTNYEMIKYYISGYLGFSFGLFLGNGFLFSSHLMKRQYLIR